MVDTQDLKSCSFGSAGSIPALGTKISPIRWYFLLQEVIHYRNLTFLDKKYTIYMLLDWGEKIAVFLLNQAKNVALTYTNGQGYVQGH